MPTAERSTASFTRYPRELAEGTQRDISDHGDWRAYRAANPR